MHDLAKALTLSIDEDQSLQQKLKSQTTSLESVEKEAKNAVALKKILQDKIHDFEKKLYDQTQVINCLTEDVINEKLLKDEAIR
jgi:septal ring factor EnvC (AmiA/AmiB activator)